MQDEYQVLLYRFLFFVPTKKKDHFNACMEMTVDGWVRVGCAGAILNMNLPLFETNCMALKGRSFISERFSDFVLLGKRESGRAKQLR